MSKDGRRSLIHIVWEPERQAYQVQFEAEAGTSHDVVAVLKSITPEHREYEPETRTWRFAASELDRLRQIALEHFDGALLTRGNLTTNLHTGRIAEQLTLFA
ncbi:hypothetical protein LLH03_06060 [bacterium]|nr:hypothetical protein [bacterium]